VKEVVFPGVVEEQLHAAAAAAPAAAPALVLIPNINNIPPEAAVAPHSSMCGGRVEQLQRSSELSKRGLQHRVEKLQQISGYDPHPVIAEYLNTNPEAIAAVNQLLTNPAKVVKSALSQPSLPQMQPGRAPPVVVIVPL